MTIRRTFCAVLLCVAGGSVPAGAEDGGFRLPDACSAPAAGAMDHAAMGHGDPAAGAAAGLTDMTADPGSAPGHVRESMRRMALTLPAMHEGMLNPDPDIAFACAMIAHHQGAIDMAEVLLEHGSDPQMRALAEAIIAAQAAEIAWMTGWLARTAP